jgi:hypothetical protein
VHDKNAMLNWEGHERDTSARLLDVIITASTGSAKVSRSDRILFVACEFWAAARNCTLVEQLRDDSVAQLRAAEESFAEIGLAKSAKCLRLGRNALTADPPAPVPDVAESIEKWLADVDEPVDLLIAEFAKKLASVRKTGSNDAAIV